MVAYQLFDLRHLLLDDILSGGDVQAASIKAFLLYILRYVFR